MNKTKRQPSMHPETDISAVMATSATPSASSAARPGGQATPGTQDEELLELDQLHLRGIELHEIFENQRWSPRDQSYGSTYPGHLQPSDPMPFTNRLHQKISGRHTKEEIKPPYGWEFLGEKWELDTVHTDCDEEEGWSYGIDFPQLEKLLLERQLSQGASKRGRGNRARTNPEPVPVPVRWRRWVRVRRLVPDTAGLQRVMHARGAHGSSGAVAGYDKGAVPLKQIVCEGWLARVRQGRWVQQWAVLVLGRNGNSASLVYCDSGEGLRVLEQVSSPPANFRTHDKPHLHEQVRRTLDLRGRHSTFALGVDGEVGTALRATSPSDARRWIAAFAKALDSLKSTGPQLTPLLSQGSELGGSEAAAGDEAGEGGAGGAGGEGTRASGSGGGGSASLLPPGTLTIEMLGAKDLAAADRGGTSDPYATVTVKAGTQTHYKKTEVVKKSLNPTWRSPAWQFSAVWSSEAQVVVLIKDYDLLARHNEPIGQVNFELGLLELPTDGTPVEKSMKLGTVTEGGRKSRVTPTGEVRLKVGWRQGSEEEQAAAVERVSNSKELEGYADYVDEEGDDSAGEEAEGEDEERDSKGGLLGMSRAERAAAREQEAINKRPKRGEYQLQVHVLEARDLVGRDWNGVSDPAVFVKAFGQTRHTATKEKQASPVWDEQLFISGADLDEDKLNQSQIEVQVFDMDTFSRDDLVGQYTFDVLHVYYSPNHQVWRQWVALSAPYAAREKVIGGGADRGGIQGYLRLSVSLLGPGDKPVVHEKEEEDDKAGGDGLILLPPTMKREVVFLRVGLYRAYHLPEMDKTLIGGRVAGAAINAYAKVVFAGYKAKTQIVDSQSPAWHTEFWIPVLVPSVGQRITISIRDKDKFTYQEVDTLYLSFDDVLKEELPKLGWYHLYGLGSTAEDQASQGSIEATLRRQRSEVRHVRSNNKYFQSEWRGKLLVSLSVHRQDEKAKKPLPEKLLQKPLNPLNDKTLKRRLPEARYELRAAVLMGSDLNAFFKTGEAARGAFVEVVIEKHVYRTQTPEGDEGLANWLCAPGAPDTEPAPGVLRKTDEWPLTLSRDRRQLPSIMLYLCDAKGKRVAFARYEPGELLDRGLAFMPAWRVLKPTAATDGEAAMPSLLLSMALGLAEGEEEPRSSADAAAAAAAAAAAVPRPPWPPPKTAADGAAFMPPRTALTGYELRVHLFLGRKLPALDSDGVLDAYVVCSLGGVKARGRSGDFQSAVQPDTVFPAWFETLSMQVWLPPLELAPEMVLECWDKDRFAEKDDFVGTARMSLRNALRQPGADAAEKLPPPEWVKLGARGTREGSGEILMMLDLLPLDKTQAVASPKAAEGIERLLPSKEPMPNLQPQTRPMELELAVIGLRGVRAPGVLDLTQAVMGPRRPFVEVCPGSSQRRRGIGGVAAGSRSVHTRRTSASNTPSAQNPTYLEVLTMRLELPTNRLFLPTMTVRVKDSLFGGLRTPQLGVSAIHLEQRLPADWQSGDLPWQPPNEVTVETWENQRKYPLPRKPWVQWSKNLLPTDPPSYSTGGGPPYTELPFDAEPFELPTHEWSWKSDWQIDMTLKAHDAEGWGYALDFHAAGVPYTLGTKTWNDFVRRRRWVRTRVRSEAAAEHLFEAQRAAKPSVSSQPPDPRELAAHAAADSEEDDDAALAAADRPRDRRSLSEPSGGGGARPRPIMTKTGTQGLLQVANGDSAFGAVPVLSQRSTRTESRSHSRSQSRSLSRTQSAQKPAQVRTQSSGTHRGSEQGTAIRASAGSSNTLVVMSPRQPAVAPPGTTSPDDVTVQDGAPADIEMGAASTVAAADAPGEGGEEGEVGEGPRPYRPSEDPNAEDRLGDSLELQVLAGAVGGDGRLHVREDSGGEAAWAGDGEEEEDEHDGDGGEDVVWPEEQLLSEIEVVEDQIRTLRDKRTRLKGEKAAKRPDQQAQRLELSSEIKKVEKELKQRLAELRDLEKKFDAAEEPRYLQNRQRVAEELEGLLGTLPFEHFVVESGQGESRVRVASLKAVVRLKPVGDGEPDDEEANYIESHNEAPTDPIAALRQPREYVVRLYVLQGINLMPLDVGSASDPYLKVSLGRTTIDTRDRYIKDATTAHFHEFFELRTQLPGESMLRIECIDYDSFGRRSDDLIGATEIDLEDRWFSPRWRDELSSKPPVEWRSLHSKLSKHPQGVLELWLEIMSPADAEATPPWDIAQPPPQEWELRVICWKCRGVPTDGSVDYSGLADLYVAARFGADGKEKRTDTHFRARNGRASWNYRYKWPVEMDANMKFQYLTLQLWDKDITSNDFIGEQKLNLGPWFKRTYRRKAKRPIYLDVDALDGENRDGEKKRAADRIAVPAKSSGLDLMNLSEVAESLVSDKSALLDFNEVDEELEAAKFWLKLKNSDGKFGGELLVSVELVPKSELESRPAGHGRSDPNTNPVLPKPVGRLSFTFNPFALCFRLLGPKLCRQACAASCCIIYVVLLFWLVPAFLGNLLWAPFEAIGR